MRTLPTAAILLALLVAGCSGRQGAPTPSTTTTAGRTAATPKEMATIVFDNWKSGDQAALLSTSTPFTAARLAAVPTYEAENMELHGCYSEGNQTHVCTWIDPFRWSMLAIRVVMGPGKPESTDATFTPPPAPVDTTTTTATTVQGATTTTTRSSAVRNTSTANPVFPFVTTPTTSSPTTTPPTAPPTTTPPTTTPSTTLPA